MQVSVFLNLVTLAAIGVMVAIMYIGFRQNSSVQNLAQLFNALKEKGILTPIRKYMTGEIGSFQPAQAESSVGGISLDMIDLQQVPTYSDFELI